MTRQPTPRFWALASSLLVLGLVLAMASPALAWRGHRHPGFSVGPRHRFHHHHHHHRGSRYFLGFHFYGYPYYYSPYYYSPYSYGTYSPGEHRQFPAFRLPGFFHYPGSLGKGEEEPQTAVPQAEGTRQDMTIPLEPQRRSAP